jgi:basic amino acid/polyamine antiporter, APA family
MVACCRTADEIPVTNRPGRLARRLGLGDAIVVGLGSMIGAGVFTAFAPAAAAAVPAYSSV